MRLRPELPATRLDFERGADPHSIPNTGDVNKPLSAAWWTKAQILSSAGLEYAPGKIFLGRVDHKMIGVADDRHLVTIAGSRAGKSSCLLIPNLMLYPGSALVIDPKGELARATAAQRKALGHDVHVLDPWSVSGVPEDLLSCFSPLAELRDSPAEIIDNADLVADALIIGSPSDPHWTNAARALLRALVLWLVLGAGEDSSLSDLPAVVATLAGEGATPEGFLDALSKIDLDEVPESDREAVSLIRSQARVMMGPNDKEIASILSTARTQLAFLESPAMTRNLRPSALRLKHLGERPTTIYLCLPATRMGTHSRWLRLIVSLAVAAMEGRGVAAGDPKRGPAPVLFVLEEFAALGHLEMIERAVAYLAGFGVKLWAVLQDLSQLKRHYKDGWETFLGNAGYVQVFGVSDMTTCEYFSKRLGETTFQVTNKVDVNADQAMKGDTGLRREFKTAPLLSPDELAIKVRRRTREDGAPAGLTLVVPAGDARPFMIDRVFFGDLVA